ncbi:MAG: hypothetical protein US49_C0003G0042 [candidate division TM6 bacterium GW2011_GWF2_37_49]|nr:MAG: hypothetical protein US49_C0003G0042 [candidate division TM6 bacterium GW2011_GWF2_37_49]
MKLKKIFNGLILSGIIICFSNSACCAAAAPTAAPVPAPADGMPAIFKFLMSGGDALFRALEPAAQFVGKAVANIVDETGPIRDRLYLNQENMMHLDAQIRAETLQNYPAAIIKLSTDRMAELAAERQQLNADLHAAEARITEVKAKGANIVQDAMKSGLDELKAQGEQARKVQLAQIDAEGKAMADIASSKYNTDQKFQFLRDLLNDKIRLLMFIGLALLLVGGTFGLYHGTKLAAEYIKTKFGRPSLVRESSRASFKQAFIKTLKTLIFGTIEEQELIFSDMVLEPKIQSDLFTFAEDVRQARNLGFPYTNAIFYGEPGTGKTMAMRSMAKSLDMDYAILSGADVSQFRNGEGVTELNKLFDWAKNSKKGLMVFIDEADSLFRSRETLDKEGVDNVNKFLAETGEGLYNCMIVISLNNISLLDSAVRSRFGKIFAFETPSIDVRFKMLMLKLNKYIINYKRKYTKDDELVEVSLATDTALDEALWKDVAARIEGFSGRDIQQLVEEMRMRGYRSGQNVLTKEIVEYAVMQKIEKVKQDRIITEYQRKKLEKETGLVFDAVPQAAAAV